MRFIEAIKSLRKEGSSERRIALEKSIKKCLSRCNLDLSELHSCYNLASGIGLVSIQDVVINRIRRLRPESPYEKNLIDSILRHYAQTQNKDNPPL